MTINENPEIGQEWAYRDSDTAEMASERVTVIGAEPSGKSSIKYKIELNGGRTKKVPRARLKALWGDHTAIDDEINRWVRLLEQTGRTVENDAASWIIEAIVSRNLIELGSEDEFVLKDKKGLEELLGVSVDDLLQGIITEESSEGTRLSPLGGMRIGQQLCKTQTAAVMHEVTQAEQRDKLKLRKYMGIEGAVYNWDFYISHARPVHEIVREWCGYERVHQYERYLAAELESDRLFELAKRLIESVEKSDPAQAERYKQELLVEQVTPYNVRQTPERPLDPAEVPVRVVKEYRPRWW